LIDVESSEYAPQIYFNALLIGTYCKDYVAIEYFEVNSCGSRTVAEVRLEFKYPYLPGTTFRLGPISLRVTTVALYLSERHVQQAHMESWAVFSTTTLQLPVLENVSLHFYEDTAASDMVETHEVALQRLHNARKLGCYIWDDIEEDWYPIEFIVSSVFPSFRMI
jgi:hypothetical protein